MPDPKLKTVAAEIKAVLNKHDVAGIVLLTSKTHSEFMYELMPSWSCCIEEQREGGRVVRFRALRKDYPSKEAQQTAISDSVGMVMGLLHLSEGSAAAMGQIALSLGKVMNISAASTDESPRFSR